MAEAFCVLFTSYSFWVKIEKSNLWSNLRVNKYTHMQTTKPFSYCERQFASEPELHATDLLDHPTKSREVVPGVSSSRYFRKSGRHSAFPCPLHTCGSKRLSIRSRHHCCCNGSRGDWWCAQCLLVGEETPRWTCTGRSRYRTCDRRLARLSASWCLCELKRLNSKAAASGRQGIVTGRNHQGNSESAPGKSFTNTLHIFTFPSKLGRA